MGMYCRKGRTSFSIEDKYKALTIHPVTLAGLVVTGKGFMGNRYKTEETRQMWGPHRYKTQHLPHGIHSLTKLRSKIRKTGQNVLHETSPDIRSSGSRLQKAARVPRSCLDPASPRPSTRHHFKRTSHERSFLKEQTGFDGRKLFFTEGRV